MLTGDFLFTKAFSLITQNVSQKNMHRLSSVIKSICEGKWISSSQVYSRCFRNPLPETHFPKDSRAFSLSCQVGAAESNCRRETIRLLRKFGHDFGMAFQITDDLLDFSGNEEEIDNLPTVIFWRRIYPSHYLYLEE